MHLLPGILLNITLLTAAVCGENPDPAKDPAGYLARLSGDNWKQRQAAEEELVRMGPAGRPLIHKLLSDPNLRDPEVRSRLETALRRIDDNRTAGPSYLTLHVKDAAPGDVATELARQAGAAIPVRPDDLWDQPRLPRITLDLERQPYWGAMRRFAAQASVAVALTEDGWALQRAAGGSTLSLETPAVRHGPFLVLASEVWRSRSVKPLAAPEQNAFDGKAGDILASERDQFGITLTVLGEPKLRVLRAADTVRLTEALDDRGHSLLPQPGEAGAAATLRGGRTAWVYGVPLRYPPERPGRRIARLNGTIPFTLQTSAERLELDDVIAAGRVTRELKGGRITAHVTEAPDGKTFTLMLTIARPLSAEDGAAAPQPDDAAAPQPGGAPAERLTRWMVYQHSAQRWLRLEDAAGRPLPRTGFGSRVLGDDVELTLHFTRPAEGGRNQPGPPKKLTWDLPTATEEVEVEFEFKDLPMP